MSSFNKITFGCDRCSAIAEPRKHRNGDDDDGFPFDWSRIHLTVDNEQLHWDLCRACMRDVMLCLHKGEIVSQELLATRLK